MLARSTTADHDVSVHDVGGTARREKPAHVRRVDPVQGHDVSRGLPDEAGQAYLAVSVTFFVAIPITIPTTVPGPRARCCGVAEVGILVYDDMEVLDFCGPFEVFGTASRVALRRSWTTTPFIVHTVAAGERSIVARGGLHLVASCTVDDHPPFDIVIVPGGVTHEVEGDGRLMAWLTSAAEKAAITASVCTGAFLLATAGLLDGRAATSHWEDVDELERRFPAVTVRRGTRWVDEGRVVTSAGISAGIDMSLHLVRRMEGEELARATAHQMDYEWRSDG